jgi:squalene synthase HpnC
LLPKRLRPHVAKYYDFARAIDDIADNPTLTPEEKVERLDGFKDAILGKTGDKAFEKAIVLRESLLETNVDLSQALDLISAFKQDSWKLRYENWEELIDYCDRSAAPVGRYLLELHGEDTSAFKYSDALCNALQVINHLQDCKDDLEELDRAYIPKDWLKEFGGKIEDIKGEAATIGLTKAIHRCIDGSLDLMILARQLPANLTNRSLAMESATIIRIADKLLEKLAAEDPVAGRVELSKWEYFTATLRGVFSVLFSKKANR